MTTAGQSERPKRMLVIDDNKGWCEIVGVMANSLGYSVEAVGSPDEAYMKLAQAQQEGSPFRLAIVDMRFEIGDYNVSLGKDVIKTIKDNYPQTACILSSGEKLTPGDVLDLRDDYGLDYCLPKVDIERDKLISIRLPADSVPWPSSEGARSTTCPSTYAVATMWLPL